MFYYVLFLHVLSPVIAALNHFLFLSSLQGQYAMSIVHHKVHHIVIMPQGDGSGFMLAENSPIFVSLSVSREENEREWTGEEKGLD